MKLSFSQWSQYKKCPQQWYFKNLRRVPGKPDNRVFLEGKVVHTLNEMYLRSADRSILAILRQAPQVMRGEIASQGIKLREDETELDVYNTIACDFMSLVKKEHQVGIFDDPEPKVEWWFTMPIPGTKHQITGASDMIFRPKSLTTRILDFKNTDSMYYLDQDQLVIYDIAYLQKTGIKSEKCGFLLIKTGNVVWYDIGEDTHAWLIEKLVRWMAEVDVILAEKKPKFPTKPEYQKCRWCAYKHICDDAAKADKPKESPVQKSGLQGI